MLMLFKIKGYIMSMLEGTGRLLQCLIWSCLCSVFDYKWITIYTIIILLVLFLIASNKYNWNGRRKKAGGRDKVGGINKGKTLPKAIKEGTLPKAIKEGTLPKAIKEGTMPKASIMFRWSLKKVPKGAQGKVQKVGSVEGIKAGSVEGLKEVSMEGSKESNVVGNKDGNKESDSDKEGNKEDGKGYGGGSGNKQSIDTK